MRIDTSVKGTPSNSSTDTSQLKQLSKRVAVLRSEINGSSKTAAPHKYTQETGSALSHLVPN